MSRGLNYIQKKERFTIFELLKELQSDQEILQEGLCFIESSHAPPFLECLQEYVGLMCRGGGGGGVGGNVGMGVISKVDEKSGGEYVVNLAKIYKNVQIDLLGQVIQEKFGQMAKRLWRILCLAHPQRLDEKTVLFFWLF